MFSIIYLTVGDMDKVKVYTASLIQKSKTTPQSWLKIAQLHAEKCELKEAQVVYAFALKEAKKIRDLKSSMEAIAGLLRLSAEALDSDATEKWDRELNRCMNAYPRQIPPMAWYCKGAVAHHQNQFRAAQRYFHRFLRASRKELKSEEGVVRGWLMLALMSQKRKQFRRALWLIEEILRRYEAKNLRGINGILYLILGTFYEYKQDVKIALSWYQKADIQFLGEHNWYQHLYALYGYARISRIQQDYSKSYWYLDLVDQAVSAPEFSLLRSYIAAERRRLEQDAVDLLIDSRKGTVKTRESGHISLRKQFVLLHLLEALSIAHRKSGSDLERGLSKSEIIQYVWKEAYSPEVHDNKLYYNINRLRKLIEPDVHKPQYLLNWKEGYRLAPNLKIQHLNGGFSQSSPSKGR